MKDVRLGGAQQVATKLGVAPTTIWRMEKSGTLPSPLRIGGRTLWRLDLIEAWIEDQTRAQALRPDMRRSSHRERIQRLSKIGGDQ